MVLVRYAKPMHVTTRAAKPLKYIYTVTICNLEDQTPFKFLSNCGGFLRAFAISDWLMLLSQHSLALRLLFPSFPAILQIASNSRATR
jgi:hypothetical protein